MDWNKILNWKLLAGSHGFPGPDGGTCINEAAIVAAGFKYRAVSTSADCPRCFSPVISEFAISINDTMADNMRQELLMPFVSRFAGTADSLSVEIERASYIVREVVRRIFPLGLSAAVVVSCKNVKSLSDAYHAVKEVVNSHHYSGFVPDITDVIEKITTCAENLAGISRWEIREELALAVRITAEAVGHIAWQCGVTDSGEDYPEVGAVFRIATQILDEAIKLGKEPALVDVTLIAARMNKIRLEEVI